ncbi:MAG: hypothetical protein K2N06_00100 [Oscillospiraceae bacterium]|nr:hypothetical protein [Oscillospiraceae bacterium]
MDISFHYFAVKSVARAAGYDELRAQQIAVFSQFIDDYNWYSYFRAANIPYYIKDKKLDIVFNETAKLINPVTTGFIDWVDMATLVLPRPQKYTVSAFHFIPQDSESAAAGDKRAVPATLNDGSYISTMLQELQTEIASHKITDNDALMRMGMLFHTFADTYAHQLFTGYNNKVNSVKLISATDNITGDDVTEKYHFWIEKWIARVKSIIKTNLPTIGHMAIAHIPDLSHLSFEMEYTVKKDDKRYETRRHSRSNTSVFVTACKQLYDYMRGILGDHPANMEWDELSEKLARGFLIDATDELDKGESAAFPKLKAHWSGIFPNYSYSYDSEQIKRDFVTAETNDICTIAVNGTEMSLTAKNYSDDFYKFNYFADLHLIRLYGEHPRNWLSVNEAEDNDLVALINKAD